MSVKVSVVVPVYNVEKYIKQCVESLISQSYEDIEIILVDDGSTDSSGIICDQYADIDDRIIVLHDKNGGLSEARRRGIEKASGEYIIIVDGDDWVDENTIEECLNTIYNHKELECVIFSYIREYPDHSIEAHVMSESVIMDRNDVEKMVYRRLFGLIGEELKHPERLENMGSCCMKLYRRDVAKRGRFFDVKDVGSSEDVLFNMYALYGCTNIAYIDKTMYHYRKTGSSITSTYRPMLITQWKRLFSIMYTVIEENKLNESYLQALNSRISLSIMGVGMNELHNAETAKRKIKSYINEEVYRNAINSIQLRFLPLPWKALLWFSKKRLYKLVYLELRTIEKIKRMY